ncbi:MAG: hypothetical protein O7A09_11365 [Proteobacteria bacterium]|nr:hypothetical protein [Pseudomonadota bacterium]MCZ6783401.1 hypothetical protein [Pseudomonadota bacterium]
MRGLRRQVYPDATEPLQKAIDEHREAFPDHPLTDEIARCLRVAGAQKLV